jgi:hypothetical protein
MWTKKNNSIITYPKQQGETKFWLVSPYHSKEVIMKEIKLTKGKFALVDDEDYEYLSQWKWYCSHGYAVRDGWIEGKRKHICMHRLIANTPEDMETDHINRNRLDNRHCNLRNCTSHQNSMNRKIYCNNKSGYKGVYWSKAMHEWVAQICFNRKNIYLGSFDDIDEAIDIYDMKARELFGEFAEVIGE